ncbi:hypothetical protein QBC40DRAFT_319019 [Triangularia verruculosa]|uniref:Uncharacterized protein n=1 Tax=Triangularia verruculosa TaxID=2587418 RepID=A0AAN6X6J0_9PEZI|nr:hypothetical protein QBC40DRAFT_319019 [Triangularia verruculosa]
MFNPFRSVRDYVITRRATIDDTEQDSAFASADNQIVDSQTPDSDVESEQEEDVESKQEEDVESKQEEDIESKHEENESVGGLDGTNDDDEESGSDKRQSTYYSAESGSDKRQSTYYSAESGSDYSQDGPEDAKGEVDDEPMEDAKSEVSNEPMEDAKDEVNDEVAPNPVTPPPQPINSSQETDFGGDWLDEVSEEEHAKLQRIAEEGQHDFSENSWAPEDDLAGLNAPSPTPSELERRAARARRFAIPDPSHHARSPWSVDDSSSDSPGDEFSRPRNSQPKPPPRPTIPFNYTFTPARETQLARADLVKATPSDELYYSHPNPLTLQHPNWLVFPPSSDPSNSTDDLEQNIQRTIHSFECYYNLPSNETVPQWMETLIRELVTWSSSPNPSLTPKKAGTYSGAVSEPWSDSTGILDFYGLGSPADEQPGEFYWTTPSDLVPLLFRADHTIKGRPKNALTVTNPDPETPKQEQPSTPQKGNGKRPPPEQHQPKPPQKTKSKRPAISPTKQTPPFKRGRSHSDPSSPGWTTDGAADSRPVTPISNWPPKREDATRVVKPAKTAPVLVQDGKGYTFWDILFFLLMLVSLLWAWQLNILVTAGYGGYMNGGHHGWDTFLTFSNLVHIVLIMAPCLYFGFRLAYNSS